MTAKNATTLRAVDVLSPAEVALLDQKAVAERALATITADDVEASEQALIVIGNVSAAHVLLFDLRRKRAEAEIAEARAQEARAQILSLQLEQEAQRLKNEQLRIQTIRDEEDRKRRDTDYVERDRIAHQKLEVEVRIGRAEAEQKELVLRTQESIAAVQLGVARETAKVEEIRRAEQAKLDAPFRRRAVVTLEEALLGNITPTVANPFRPLAAMLYLRRVRVLKLSHAEASAETVDHLVERMRGSFSIEDGREYERLWREQRDEDADRAAGARLREERALEAQVRAQQERLKNELAYGGLNDDQK